MEQVPGSWISDRMFERLVENLAKAPLVPVHQISSYAMAFPNLGSRKSEHSRRQARGLSWPLTADQQKIVQLLADGKVPKEIAAELGKNSETAVIGSLARARARAGCRTNIELVARAVASRIVSIRKPLDVENTPGRLVVTIASKTFSFAEEVREPAETLERELAARLSDARVAMGYMQPQAAELIGISVGRLNQIEGGHAFPSMKQYLAMCVAYNKSPAELMPSGYTPGTSSRDPRAFVNHISLAEKEVLEEVAEGLSYLEIAQRRQASEETVKSQMKSLREKLGARDRAHAVALGYRNGVLR